MDLVWTLLGVALIGIALRDIFDVLFHPLGRGMVARKVVRGVAWLAQKLPRSGTIGLLAGPLSYVAVVATWATLLALGWALVFLPQLPDGFNFDPALNPAEHSGFFDALYISLVNLTSLGYGDISPATSLLRVLGPVETMFGLGLLTASISWGRRSCRWRSTISPKRSGRGCGCRVRRLTTRCATTNPNTGVCAPRWRPGTSPFMFLTTLYGE
ncbi:MAG: hypothetical protein QOF06_1103 [Solirubrobacterales bacterium]|nr:hypothetical protein [Solirubrobacterales bacterium]